jgi:putative phosphonate metabolism protein
VSARLALYWAPEAEDPLHAAASRWLGRDTETGATFPQSPLPGVDIAEITADARSYGFHATLKPPFHLATSYATAREDAAKLAARTAPFALPPLQVTDLRGFLALTESVPCPALNAFADECVAAMDAHRAPPTEAEIARRNPTRMNEKQREFLNRWGYPYVFEEWFFHLTLSRRLSEEEKAIVLPAVQQAVGETAARPRIVRELCLFTQPERGAPFLVAERLPLTGVAA